MAAGKLLPYELTWERSGVMGAHIMNGRVFLDGRPVEGCRSEVLEREKGHECDECGEPAIGRFGVWGRNPHTRNPVHVAFWLCSTHHWALLKKAPAR